MSCLESKVILNSTTYELLSDMDMPDVFKGPPKRLESRLYNFTCAEVNY